MPHEFDVLWNGIELSPERGALEKRALLKMFSERLYHKLSIQAREKRGEKLNLLS